MTLIQTYILLPLAWICRSHLTVYVIICAILSSNPKWFIAIPFVFMTEFILFNIAQMDLIQKKLWGLEEWMGDFSRQSQSGEIKEIDAKKFIGLFPDELIQLCNFNFRKSAAYPPLVKYLNSSSLPPGDDNLRVFVIPSTLKSVTNSLQVFSSLFTKTYIIVNDDPHAMTSFQRFMLIHELGHSTLINFNLQVRKQNALFFSVVTTGVVAFTITNYWLLAILLPAYAFFVFQSRVRGPIAAEVDADIMGIRHLKNYEERRSVISKLLAVWSPYQHELTNEQIVRNQQLEKNYDGIDALAKHASFQSRLRAINMCLRNDRWLKDPSIGHPKLWSLDASEIAAFSVLLICAFDATLPTSILPLGVFTTTFFMVLKHHFNMVRKGHYTIKTIRETENRLNATLDQKTVRVEDISTDASLSSTVEVETNGVDASVYVLLTEENGVQRFQLLSINLSSVLEIKARYQNALIRDIKIDQLKVVNRELFVALNNENDSKEFRGLFYSEEQARSTVGSAGLIIKYPMLGV